MLPRGLFNSNPALTAIDMSYNNLVAIPEGVFYQLTSMTMLNLSSNKIITLSQSAFYDLVNLEYLDLSHNYLATVPNSPFFFTNQLVTDSPITINLIANNLTSVPKNMSVFRYFPCLVQILLYRNSISNVTAMGIENIYMPPYFSCRFNSSSSLNVDLGNNSLSTIGPMAFAGNLAYRVTSLSLTDNYLTSISAKMFSGLNGLLVLDLSYNLISTIENGSFAELRLLQRLHLNANQLASITDATFSGLSTLSYLNLAYSYLGNAVFRAVTDLISLKQLVLDYTNIVSINATEAFSPYLALTYLSLRGNYGIERITNVDSVLLGWSLQYLDIGATSIGVDFMQQDLPNFRKLVELRMSSNYYLNQMFPNSFSASLKILDLSDNRLLTSESLAALSGTATINLVDLKLDGIYLFNLLMVRLILFVTNLTINRLLLFSLIEAPAYG